MPPTSEASSDIWSNCESFYDKVTDGLSGLRTDGTLSDFSLVSGSKEWKIHKVVLYMHSDVLYKMSTSENFTECKSGRAELKDLDGNPFDPKCIDALVRYMYDNGLVVPWLPEDHLQHSVGCHGWQESTEKTQAEVMNLSAIDNTSQVPPLMEPGLGDDEENVRVPAVHGDCVTHPTEGLDFLVSMANLAEMYNIEPLKNLAEHQIICYNGCKMPGKLSAVVDCICRMATVPDAVRKNLVKGAANYIGRFHKTQTLEDHPEFATEVFKRLIRVDHKNTKKRERAEAARLARRDSLNGDGWNNGWGG